MLLRDELLNQALALPKKDRALLANALEESLQRVDEDVQNGVDFSAELQRRSAAYRTGTSTAREASDVLADLRQRQTDEKQP